MLKNYTKPELDKVVLKEIVALFSKPPFNQKDWVQPLLVNDLRDKFGTPTEGSVNYGWREDILQKLSRKGRVAVVLANGHLSL